MSSAQPSSAQLSSTWSRLLAASWVLAAIAHGFVSVASRRTGKSLWWVDNDGMIGAATPVLGAAIVYLAMLTAFVITVRRIRRAPFLSALVAIGLATSALVDLPSAAGSALVALAASGAAFFASVAALAGVAERH
jgi:hypothetical protein